MTYSGLNSLILGSNTNYWYDSVSTTTGMCEKWINKNTSLRNHVTEPIKEKEMKKKDDIKAEVLMKNLNLDGENIEMTPEFAEAFEKAYKEAKKKKKYEVVPRPEDPIRNILFNMEKDITTVVWKDGTVTMVTCNPYDFFDEEKAIALCFMKKFFDNRGCYNSFMKKYLDKAEYVE